MCNIDATLRHGIPTVSLLYEVGRMALVWLEHVVSIINHMVIWLINNIQISKVSKLSKLDNNWDLNRHDVYSWVGPSTGGLTGKSVRILACWEIVEWDGNTKVVMHVQMNSNSNSSWQRCGELDHIIYCTYIYMFLLQRWNDASRICEFHIILYRLDTCCWNTLHIFITIKYGVSIQWTS